MAMAALAAGGVLALDRVAVSTNANAYVQVGFDTRGRFETFET